MLGIDYGLARTGIAICDAGEQVVFPLATLRLDDFGARAPLLNHITTIAHTRKAEALVLGLPLHGDGSESETSRQVRNVVARLKRRIELPIFLMPEYLSSSEALADLRQAGVGRGKILAVLDQQAACRILQSFLAQRPEQRVPA